MKKESSDSEKNVAIIGMACRFPGAENYEEYWKNISAGKHCISEIPKQRWDWKEYYGDPIEDDNTTNIIHGGFIDDVDKFDPLFFNISPREAAYMDPQHRLFLESVWHSIEDAGYNPLDLAGRNIGVYAGVSKNDYAELMRELKVPIISFLSTGTVHSILANRVSYLLDFTGKSEVVDTACSSFLVALDKAINDINSGECEAAVVGGVNTILSPTMYISHSKSGMLSHDGACKSFDNDANGYVRSEGVGVVFLKSLAKAIEDKDNILGVIKGIAIKHGGKSNFLTAPKISSQAATISAAITNAKIDPRTIGYLEAHGTGTPLGDPIEIEALKKAYSPYMKSTDTAYCGLTSAKTNVGHLESAAGVAALIKVLLSFKNKKIPALLHFEELNSHINLDNGPFYIVNKNRHWVSRTIDGINHPLRAGISSFGMGGVNAHIIVEEPPQLSVVKSMNTPPDRDIGQKYIVPITAKDDKTLNIYVKSIFNYLSQTKDSISIEDIAFTLQSGRSFFDKRVAFVVSDYTHLISLLEKYISEVADKNIFYSKKFNKSCSDIEENDHSTISFEKIAKNWVMGNDVKLYKSNVSPSGKRIQLPTYPFIKLRCWFPMKPEKKTISRINENIDEKYNLTFTIEDYFIRDHVVKGENLVPGVKCLDLFCLLGEKINQTPIHKISDVYWIRPIKITNTIDVTIKYSQHKENSDLTLSLINGDDIYCTGVGSSDRNKGPNHRLDIEKIKSRCQTNITRKDLYHHFDIHGLSYGESFQVINICNFNENEIICKLKKTVEINPVNCILEPSILDGVFQSVVALQTLSENKPRLQQVPFYLKAVKIHQNIPDECYVYASQNKPTSTDADPVYNMYLCDLQGEIIVEFSEFVKTTYLGSDAIVVDQKESTQKVLNYTTQWVERNRVMHKENINSVILFDTDDLLFNRWSNCERAGIYILVKIGDKYKKVGKNSYFINPDDVDSFKLLWDELVKQGIDINCIIYKWNFKNSTSLLNNLDLSTNVILLLIQSLIFAKLSKKIHIFYLYSIHRTIQACIHACVGGFSRTLAHENPNIKITSIGLDTFTLPKLSDIVLEELNFYSNGPLNEIQYINGIRKVRVVTSYEYMTDKVDFSLIKQRGIYLIAGGTGGLGYLFAQYLAKNYAAKIILIGRSRKNEKIEGQIKELTSLGGSGEYYSANINNKTSITKTLKDIETKNIQINGILNCAGLIDDAYIINKSKESFSKVIAPKIHGTINLDEASKKLPLDFFVIFSSIASIMPNQGQCDYASANSFVDEFSRYRNELFKQQKRKGLTVAINWPLWKDGGIGVIKEEQDYLWDVFGMRPLESIRGLSLFESILSQCKNDFPEHIITVEGDKEKLEKHLNVLPQSNYVKNKSKSLEEIIKEELRIVISKQHISVRNIHDTENVTEYGIDSIGLTAIAEKISQQFSIDINPALFFDINTVSKLFNYLHENHDISELVQSLKKKKTVGYTSEQALIDYNYIDNQGHKFQKLLSDEEFFMKDHIVDGLYNVPGACYIEMALQAGNIISSGKNIYTLSNNYWAKQLSTSGEPIRADLCLSEKDGHFEYEITHAKGKIINVHALGQLHIRKKDNDKLDNFSIAKIDDIKSRCTVTRKVDEIYKIIHAEGLHVGPSFQPMIKIHLNKQEAISHLKLPEFILNTADDYILHPSMLTGVLQTALLNNKPDGVDGTQYIPIAIDNIVIYAKIPNECLVYSEVVSLTNKNNSIKKFNAKIITLDGDVIVEVIGLSLRNLSQLSEEGSLEHRKTVNTTDLNVESIDIFHEQVCDLLKNVLSDATGIPVDDIASDTHLDSYGINSIMIVDLNRRLEKVFGNLSKTLFFEYRNISELSEYFIQHHENTLKLNISDVALLNNSKDAKQSDHTSQNITELSSEINKNIFIDSLRNEAIEKNHDSDNVDKGELIAVVGISGRYPEADNITQFWENLESGRDCIQEIPKSRFNKEDLYNLCQKDDLLPEKWGGFINDVDKFDPAFFNISPREAKQIDPQERLFLQVAWETIEDAGYNYNDLKGQSIGVFVGALWQPYISLGVEQTFKGNLQHPSGLLYSIANRVSFYFDWCGPSLAVDTACSASLTALHLACESLKRHESNAALVGGVNLSIGSSKFMWLSKNNFLSSDGKCRSFGEGGDGYVPGEGIGSVYLKRLKDAVQDNDHIYGLISGTSVNHGGKTNGYTVPNPIRQKKLILNTLSKCAISPERITYVEAHGTGTSLGDPIEIEGLNQAFSVYTNKKAFCAIGSVKSNIGHLEAAAGIAGLTKLLLQLKNKTLVPSIHSEKLNQNINFSSTPFYVQRKHTAWETVYQKDASGINHALPRCAMISSFGAGGSNSHAIVEEFMPIEHDQTERTIVRMTSSTHIIIPLSAKSHDRLKNVASNLLHYMIAQENKILDIGDRTKAGTISLEDIAYTLQIGREAMDERVVFLIEDISDLKSSLKKYIDSQNAHFSNIKSGNINKNGKNFSEFLNDSGISDVVTEWVKKGDARKVAMIWLNSNNVNWKLQYGSVVPRKVSLPTYPFKKESYWIDEFNKNVNGEIQKSPHVSKLHPLLHENISDLYSQKYCATYSGNNINVGFVKSIEGFTLSRNAYLEMAKEAIVLAEGLTDRVNSKIILLDVLWGSDFYVSGATNTLYIELKPDEEGKYIIFEIYSKCTEQEQIIHAKGKSKIEKLVKQDHIDLALMIDNMRCLDVNNIQYRKIIENIDEKLNTSVNMIDAIYVDDDGIMVKITNDDPSYGSNSVITIPSNVIDIATAALVAHTVINYNHSSSQISSISSHDPISIDAISISRKFTKCMYARVIETSFASISKNSEEPSTVEFDVDFVNSDGVICACFTKIKYKASYHHSSTPSHLEALVLNEVNHNSSQITPDKPTGITLSSISSYHHKSTTNTSDVAESRTQSNEVNAEVEVIENEQLSYVNRSYMDAPENHKILVEDITVLLADALYMPTSEVDGDKQFTEMGLDSIVGVEWVKSLNMRYKIDLTVTIVYDYPTINELANHMNILIGKPQDAGVESKYFKSHALQNLVSGGKLTINNDLLINEVSRSSSGEKSNQTRTDIQKGLLKSLSNALFMDEKHIDENASFTDMGLDSIVGVEWVKDINKQYDTTILATSVYDYTNLQEFTDFLHNTIYGKDIDALVIDD